MRKICGKLLDSEFPIYFTPSFVLPASAHPYEYSGVMFELFVLKNEHEYDVIATGGRYDKLVSNKLISM